MPITFKSRHSPDVLMLDTIGLEMLRLMGHSPSVPGALAAEDVAAALAKLEASVAATPDRGLEQSTHGDGDDEPREAPVSLSHRAMPLIEMLRNALNNNDYVLWEHP